MAAFGHNRDGKKGKKLGGTPSAPKARVSYTYTATESSDADGTTELASRTFTIGIRPQKPANFTAAAGDTKVTLAWTAISGVSGWEYRQDTDNWTAIAGHTVTGLTNGTSYTFRVRAHVGSGATRIDGVESDGVTATPTATVTPPGVANRAPAFDRSGYAFDLAENRSGPVSLGAVSASDPEGDALAYSLSGGGAAQFSVGANGTVSYTGPGEDFESGPGSYEFTATVTQV